MTSMHLVKQLFNSKRLKGDSSIEYKDWSIQLKNGVLLTGCASNYIVIRHLRVAYFELYLELGTPELASETITRVLEAFEADPHFLLPESVRKNEIAVRDNEEDSWLSINRLPVPKSLSLYVPVKLGFAEKEAIVGTWRSKGLELMIRDQCYAEANQDKLRPLAFISHDSRDKDKLARPLAEKLRHEVGTIWYDEYSLKVGDSLRENIESGLKASDCCVVILTKSYLENAGWARREFDSIYTREVVKNQKVILPVWVDVTKEELYEYSPILVDRLAVQWSAGIDKVVTSLAASIVQRSR